MIKKNKIEEKRIYDAKRYAINHPVKIKKCIICGMEFIAKGKDITCSKDCSNENKKMRIEKNKEKNNIYCIKYYRDSHPIRIKECIICQKEFRCITATKTCSKECGHKLRLLNMKKWRVDNKEYVESKRLENIDKSKEYDRIRNQNPDNKKRRNKKLREKTRTCPAFRINRNLSRNILSHLNFNGVCKNGRHWENMVGYTKEELIEHLENLFTDSMSWDNYGRKTGVKCWEIDHIIPKSFFNYTSTDDVEFRYCWSLDNLQPLWATDNYSKGNKLERSLS